MTLILQSKRLNDIKSCTLNDSINERKSYSVKEIMTFAIV